MEFLIKVAGQDPLPIFMRSNDFSNLYIKSPTRTRHGGLSSSQKIKMLTNSQGPDVRDQRLQ